MLSSPHRYLCHAILLIIVTGFVMPAGAGAGEDPEPESPPPRTIAIVTHLKNDVESITRGELARIFFKRQTTWPEGARCIPIDQRGESTIRREFSELILERTVYEMKRYWMQETMTGNAKPPVSLESAATVKKYLQKIRGAVAYIYLDEVDDSVRVLKVADVPELAKPVRNQESQAAPTDETDTLGNGLDTRQDTSP